MSKFNVGQEVEIVGNNCYHGYRIGQKVVILRCYLARDGDYYYDADGGGGHFREEWCITDDCAKEIKL